MNASELQTELCHALCGIVSVREAATNLWRVDTPWTFPDGDSYVLYVSLSPTGGLRISDQGLTFMRMSYDGELSRFREGTRGTLLGQIVADAGLAEDDGEFFLDLPREQLAIGVLRMGQALTRLHDLTFLNRTRGENTFYEDLRQRLIDLVGKEKLSENYIIKNLANAENYPVDFFISGGSTPLYLFGVPNRDKARLATIVLQHLIASHLNFESMVIFRNTQDMPRKDMDRLMNAANDMIASPDAVDDFERKLLRRIGTA